MNRLTDAERGMFWVYTESSRYLVHLNDRQHLLQRAPVEPDASDLRNDGEPLDLRTIGICEVGYEASFLIQIPTNPDDVVTWRRTTPVRKIEEVKE